MTWSSVFPGKTYNYFFLLRSSLYNGGEKKPERALFAFFKLLENNGPLVY